MRLLIFLLLASAAHAQYAVNVSLPRTNFLALEAIPATVTITNRSGAEVVLGGPGRASWLSFQMTDAKGYELGPIDVSGVDLAQIPPGGTIQRKITVTDAYAPTDIGNYGLMARVLHTPTGQYFGSNRVRFAITDAKAMWEQEYGVPPGFRGEGAIRKYGIVLFTDVDSTSLYLRLTDSKTGLRIQTYRLGPITMAHDPQITIDHENHLQVLFLAQPNLWSHCVVAPDGVLKRRAYYRETSGNRPRLAQEASGAASVIGGVIYDPDAAPPVPRIAN
ncbi:MAG TPA: hypothetical protein PLP58_21890 [Prosthecobacter sp.]|nr:hypothetical protein [Prosthecobacter sp.]